MEANTQPEILRRSTNFPSSPWCLDDFASLPLNDIEEKCKSYTKQVEKLIPEVKNMLTDSPSEAIDKLKLIDLLYNLGVSYHFEAEIEHQLTLLFEYSTSPGFGDDITNNYDLHTVAFIFRVFRLHGYKISCEVFNKFRDDEGKFKESLASDAKGMLSLYEAAQLNMHGETVLEHGLEFAIKALSSQSSTTPEKLAKQIAYALQQPYHKGMHRPESMQYIFFYEEDESSNPLLLNLAKLDFNRTQLLYQQELYYIARWYQDLDFASKLPYARERAVEVHLWSLGTFYEPKYSRARIFLTKVVIMISFLDDTYDTYGTIEELRVLTQAIDRWDTGVSSEELEGCMQFIHQVLVEIFDGIKKELDKEGISYCVPYAIDGMKQLVKAYHQEAEWYHQDYVPSYDEYMENALLTSSYGAWIPVCLLGIETARKHEYEWVENKPKILRAVQVIGRLMNDLVSCKREQKEGDCASSIQCYMKQYDVSEEEAVKFVKKESEEAWKVVNEEFMKPIICVEKPTIMIIVNLARTSYAYYRFEDAYTNSASIKPLLKALLVDPIPLAE